MSLFTRVFVYLANLIREHFATAFILLMFVVAFCTVELVTAQSIASKGSSTDLSTRHPSDTDIPPKQSPNPSEPSDIWTTYSNKNYGYSITYPTTFDVRKQGERTKSGGVPSDVWFGSSFHVITRIPPLDNDTVSRYWGKAEIVVINENVPAKKLERVSRPAGGGSPITSVEYLIRGDGVDYFLIYQVSDYEDENSEGLREVAVFDQIVNSFETEVPNNSVTTETEATAELAHAFDFFVNPPDGGSRAPWYTAYNARNPYLTEIAPCYNKQFSQLQHTAEDWFRSAGTNVHAVANGRVIYSSDANYPGGVVIIEHKLGNNWKNPWGGEIIYSMYGHLSPSDMVSQWSDVSRGQVIGEVLSQGSNSHIHFEMRRYGDMSNILKCPANDKSSWPGPGYTDTGVHPDTFGYTNPSSWIDSHRGGACPAPSLNQPDNNATLTSQTITFSWNSISDCDFNGYTLRICKSSDIANLDNCKPSEGYVDTGVGGTSKTVTITGHDKQDLYWGVRAANASSAHWSPARRFVIDRGPDDTKPPDVAWREPVGNGQYHDVYGQMVHLKVDASDPSGVKVVKFDWWDGSGRQYIGQDTTAPYEANLDTGQLKVTCNIIDAVAKDNRDNEGRTPIYLCLVPPIAPTINPISNGDGDGDYTVSWSSSTGATSYELQEKHNSGNWSTIYTGSSTSKTVGGKSEGRWTYRVRASGMGGQGEWSPNLEFTDVKASCSYTADQVVLFEETGYGGRCEIFDKGIYDKSSFEIFDYITPRSIRVGANVATYWNEKAYYFEQEWLIADHADLSTYFRRGQGIEWGEVVTRQSPPDRPTPTAPAAGTLFEEGDSITFEWTDSGTSYYGVIDGWTYESEFGWQYTNSKVLNNVKPDFYNWKIKARHHGESEWSQSKHFLVKPATPSNLNGVASNCRTIALYWQDQSNYEDIYFVHRDGREIARLGPNVETYTDQTVSERSTYKYEVSAYTNSGVGSDRIETSVTTPGCDNAPRLVKPRNVRATSGRYAYKVLVTWDDVPGAARYKIFRATSASGPRVRLATRSSTSFGDYTAEDGKVYYYWVKACNSSGCSGYSSYNSGWLKGSGLHKPRNVRASNGRYSYKVLVTWDAVPGATRYKIFRAASASGPRVRLAIRSGTAVGDYTAEDGKVYYYWVKACNSSGCSGYSSYNSGWLK